VRKLIATSTLCLCALFLFQANAHAQQIDVAFGGDTISAPSATSASSGFSQQSLSGGFYPTLSGDVIFYHGLGVGAEVSWRGSRNYYQPSLYFNSLPYRPVFVDFDAVYAPSLPFHFIQPQLQAGIGVESIRFYCASCGSYYGGTNYTSSKHFMGHLGFGLKFYLLGNFFVRPEVGVYLIHNNVEFSGVHATRYGISIGYTLGSH
jgi:hypothetical protein